MHDTVGLLFDIYNKKEWEAKRGFTVELSTGFWWIPRKGLHRLNANAVRICQAVRVHSVEVIPQKEWMQFPALTVGWSCLCWHLGREAARVGLGRGFPGQRGTKEWQGTHGRARAVYFHPGMPRCFETAPMSCSLEQLPWNGAFMWVQTWFQVFFLKSSNSHFPSSSGPWIRSRLESWQDQFWSCSCWWDWSWRVFCEGSNLSCPFYLCSFPSLDRLSLCWLWGVLCWPQHTACTGELFSVVHLNTDRLGFFPLPAPPPPRCGSSVLQLEPAVKWDPLFHLLIVRPKSTTWRWTWRRSASGVTLVRRRCSWSSGWQRRHRRWSSPSRWVCVTAWPGWTLGRAFVFLLQN